MNFFKGVDIEKLIISIVRNNQFKNETTVFEKIGAQLNKWLYGTIRLDPSEVNFDFRVAIDGIAGRSYQGDIGIDESNFI